MLPGAPSLCAQVSEAPSPTVPLLPVIWSPRLWLHGGLGPGWVLGAGRCPAAPDSGQRCWQGPSFLLLTLFQNNPEPPNPSHAFGQLPPRPLHPDPSRQEHPLILGSFQSRPRWAGEGWGGCILRMFYPEPSLQPLPGPERTSDAGTWPGLVVFHSGGQAGVHTP